MKKDPLAWLALAAALAVTASAEYQLARACGFSPLVAAGVPAALDVYAVRALRVHRDVLAVVAAMIAVNAASHLVSAQLLPVSVPLVVAVSAIAPLVLWRVHALRERPPAAPVPASVDFERASAEAVAVTDAPAPERPALVLDLAPMLPAPVHVTADAHPAKPPAPRPAARPAATSGDSASDTDLIKAARALATTGPLSLRRLQRELRIGQTRAQRIRDAIESGAA